MSRSLEISGESLLLVFEAVTLVVVVAFAAPAVWPIDDARSVAVAVLVALIVAVLVAAMWRNRTGGEVAHLETGYDITYDPVGDPEQAAKERWQKAVQRLPGSDDDGERNGDD